MAARRNGPRRGGYRNPGRPGLHGWPGANHQAGYRSGGRGGKKRGGKGGRGGNGGYDGGGDFPELPGVEQPANMFDQSAYDLMFQLLKDYGLESLGSELKDLIADGITDQASLTVMLQNTDAWKKRFAGNEMLRQNGLGVLSPAEYLATERAYAQVMKNYGLPEGFYDEPADYAQWIGNNVSANELNQRASMYADLARRDDAATKAQLREMGFGEGDLLAWMMDPTRAAPLLQTKYQTTLIGSAAKRTGVNATDAEHLSDLGITEQQAMQGFSVISEGIGTLDTLGKVYGEDYDQADFESEVFEGSAAAAKKRKRLASQERAAFGGQSGIQQGSLQRGTAGSY